MHCAETRARISIILRSRRRRRRRSPCSRRRGPFTIRPARRYIRWKRFSGGWFSAIIRVLSASLLSSCPMCPLLYVHPLYGEAFTRIRAIQVVAARPHVCPGLAGGDLARQPIPYPRQSAAAEAPTGLRLRYNRNPMRAAAVILHPMQSRRAASTATRKNDLARVIARSLHRDRGLAKI